MRPTRETIIDESSSRWVKSWRDLPVLINVWSAVLRAEITSTKPFSRTTEFLWEAGLTVHGTEEEAENEVMTILEIYRRLVEDQIAIPVLVGKKTEREKFKGAVYTTTVEAMMPDGKAIQMGTSHHLGQNFSKPFEIKFLGKDEKEHFAWTTSWGISWRLIGAMIMAHGDDKGLVLPPLVAPTQVEFVPIHYKESDKELILQTAHHIAESLGKHSVRTYIDDREQYTPGWKYHEWEMKGVPLRVEIGPRDMQSKQITLVRRDTGKKTAVPQADSVTHIVSMLDEIQQSVVPRAKVSEGTLTTNDANMKEFAHIIETTGGFFKAFLSQENDCAERDKLQTRATRRTVPFTQSARGQCVYCGAPNSRAVVFARSY